MPRIRRKPNWVSDDAWSDYLGRVQYHRFIDEVGGDRVHLEFLEMFEKLLRHPDCKCVWDVLYSTDDQKQSGKMLDALHWAVAGPLKDGMIPNKRRKELAQDIIDASRALRRALRAAQRAIDIPDEIFGAAYDRLLARVETHSSPVLLPDFNRAQSQLYNMGIQLATHDLIFGDDRSSIFVAIEKGAEDWAEKKAFEHKTKEPDLGKRRYFAIVMREFFMRNFGQPFNAQVAALGSALLGQTMIDHEVTLLVNSETAKNYQLPAIFRDMEPEIEID